MSRAKRKAVEFWRSNFFPDELVYCRVVPPNSLVPSAYSVEEIAEALMDMKQRYGQPQVSKRPGCGGKTVTRWEWNTTQRLYIKQFRGKWTLGKSTSPAL